jgi:hypothetical protein
MYEVFWRLSEILKLVLKDFSGLGGESLIER